MIRLGVTAFDPSVNQVGRDDAVLPNEARKLVEFFAYAHLRDVKQQSLRTAGRGGARCAILVWVHGIIHDAN